MMAEITTVKRELPKPNPEAISAKKHALQSLEDLARSRWIESRILVKFTWIEFGIRNLKELNLGQIQKVREAIMKGILK